MPRPPQRKRRAENEELRAENAELRLRLEEAEQAVEAIRTGQVESLVIDGPDGPRILSLEGATHSYRVMVESMNEGAVTSSEDGIVLYCNGRFAALLGRPLQTLMGSSLREHVPERFRAALDDLLQRAREAGVRQEMPLCAADGGEVPVYLSASAIVDAGKRVLCLVATDLREQRRTEVIAAAEQAARESEERLRLTLRHAAAGTWEWDVGSGALVWSPETYALYGVDPARAPLTRADWERVVHPDDVAATLAAAVACFEGRSAEFRGEFRVLHARLGERWLLGVARLERGADGAPARLLGLNIDITERKRAEEALREGDRRKDEFLRMLSHELRNPLAPIRNSTQILQYAEPGSDQARRARTIIERQTRHLTRLVDDLLDVTRIASGKIELRRERVDLREIVRRTAEDFRSVIEGHGAALGVEVPEAKVWADVDETRVGQAIGNLLHNAAKFTRRGDTVTLSLEAAGGGAAIRVRDTGAGIEPALLPRVFETFVQGERTLARTEGGLGLGLALVKGIVELHGGGVSAWSEGPGRGADFRLSLPLAGSASGNDGPLEGAAGHPPGRRVLVVDDNVDAAESLADTLELAGHEVEVAFDGPAALEKVRLHPPDVVLCDIGLPGMTGYQVAKALRASGLSRAQLIAVSGYAQPEDVKRSIEAGFDAHVAKPCDAQELERLFAASQP